MSEDLRKKAQILVDAQYLSKEDLDAAEKAVFGTDTSIIDYLIDEQLITIDLFGQALAEKHGVVYADLNSKKPPKEQIKKIPEDIAKKFNIILFEEGESENIVATDDPTQKGLKSALKELFPKKKTTIALSLRDDITSLFIAYQKPLQERINDVIEDTGLIPKIVDEIFIEAIMYRASDIHLEPRAKEVFVRLRIDGVLLERARIDSELYEGVINRIKVLSKLRIDTHRSTQDGSIRHEINDRYVDLRISIVPTLYGEKVVARVLSNYIKGFSLDQLGLSASDKDVLHRAAKKPFGMIINVGPTGSGKTTSLYALMRILNKPGVNITTIEDPIEYRVEGLNQIQVDSERNVTFAKGLRSIVRQDPDIILVGEIRDQETAEIAVNAALTGHLLLSTFHANDAATAIPRLLDMGVEPFLLASTLELVTGQRLVRKICENCKYSQEISKKEVEKQLGGVKIETTKKDITLYKGKGCSVCQHTGYDGRTLIFEFIEITQKMQDLILSNPSSQEIWQLAQKEGAHMLFSDGIEKVLSGVTTIEELLRVAKPPTNEKTA